MMGKKIPKINKLKEDGLKFIQVYVKDKPYLRYSQHKNGIKSYHGPILEDFLKEIGINFKTFKDRCGLGDIPLQEDLEMSYKLVGAGKVSRLSNGDLEFYSSSGSYRIGTDLKHLEELFKDEKPNIEKKSQLNHIVKFNKPQEEISETNLKSNLNDEKDSGEVPF